MPNISLLFDIQFFPLLCEGRMVDVGGPVSPVRGRNRVSTVPPPTVPWDSPPNGQGIQAGRGEEVALESFRSEDLGVGQPSDEVSKFIV